MAFGISGKVSNRLPTFYDLDETRSHFNANKNDVQGSKISLSLNDDKVLDFTRKLIISPMASSGSVVCPGFSGVVAPCPAATKYFRHKAKNKSLVNVESISKINHSKVLSRASTVGSDSTIVANGSNRKYGKKTSFAKKKSSSFDISSENYRLKRRGVSNKISTSRQCEESSFDSENEPDFCLKKDLFATKTLADPDARKDGVRDCFITQKDLPKESCGDVSWPYQGSSEQLMISFDNCRVKSFQRKHKLRRASDLNYANNKKFSQENFSQDLFKKDDVGLCGFYKDYYTGLEENAAPDGDDDTYKKLPNFSETSNSHTFKMRPKVNSDHGSFKFFQQCAQSSRNMDLMGLDGESEIMSISDIQKRPTVLYGLDGDSLNQKRETSNQGNAARTEIFSQFDNGEKFSKRSAFSEFDDEDEWIEYEDFPGDEETDSNSSYNESICVINEKTNEEKRIMQENNDKEDGNDVDDDDDTDIKRTQALPRCKRCYKRIISKRNGKENLIKTDHLRSRDDMAVETLRSKGCKNNPGFYSARDQTTSREGDGRNYEKNGNYLNNHSSWWNYEIDKYSLETNNSRRNVKVQRNNGLHDEIVNETHSDDYAGFDVATLSMSNHNNSRCFQRVFPCENASSQPEEGLQAPRCHQLIQQTGASMDQTNLYGFNKPFHFNYCTSQFSNQAAIDHFPPILSSVSGNVIHQCCPDQAKHPQQVSFLEQYPSTCNGGNWIPTNSNQLEPDQMQKCQPSQDQSFQANESHHCPQFLFNHQQQQQQHHQFQLNNLQMKSNNFVSPMMQIMDCSDKDQLFSQYCQQQQNEELEDTIRHYSPPPPPPPSHQPQQGGNQWSQQELQVLQRESRMTGTPCRHHHHYIHTNLYPNHATHLLHQLQDRLKRQKLMEDLKLDKTTCDKDNTNVDTENSSTKSNQRDQMSIRADSKESCNSAERVELESLGGESSSRKKEAVSLPDSQSISIFDSSLCHELSATDNNKTLEDCGKSADFGDCKVSNDQSREGHSSEGETLKKSKKECQKTPSRDTSIRTDSAQSETMQSLSKSNSFDKLYLDLIQNQLSSLKDSVQALTDAFYGKQEKKTDPELSAQGEVTNSIMKNFSLLLRENQSLSKRFDHLEQALSKTLKYEKENCELARETPDTNTTSKTSYENVGDQKLPQRVSLKKVHLQVDKCHTNGNDEISDVVEVQNADTLEGGSCRFSELPNAKLQQYFDDSATQHLNNKSEESHDSKFLKSDAMIGKWNGSCFLFSKSEEAAKGHAGSQGDKIEVNHAAEKNVSMTPFLEEKLPTDKSPKLMFNNSDQRPLISDENDKKKQALDNGYTYTTSNMEKNDEKLNSKSEKHHKFIVGHPMMCKADEIIAECNKFISPSYNSTDCQPNGEVKELRNNTMDSIPAIYRSFMNNSTNRFSMGGNSIPNQSDVSGKDVASFRHRFFTEERDKKRFSPCERFSTNWKSENKAPGATKDSKSDNRHQTVFPHLSDSTKLYAPCNPDTCDSVIMDMKGNGENHWRMNNIVGIIENGGPLNEYRSPSGRPENEVKCCDFMPNTLRGFSHKSKLSNLAQTCAELWDSNSRNKDSNLPKSLKNHFLSGTGLQLSIDPCSSFHMDSKDQQSSTKLKKLNNANLNFDHTSSLPLDIFQDKLATANIHRGTDYGPITGSLNFKMINVDLDKKCKQVEGTSPNSRFRICQSDLVDAYQCNTTEALLDPCCSGLETNKVINGSSKTKHSFPQKFSVSWNPQPSLVGAEGNSVSNERKFLERMKISNASLKIGDNNPTDYQIRKNLKNCPDRRDFPFKSNGKDFQNSNPVCVDECSTAILQGNLESDNNKNGSQDVGSVAKQNTVNIVFNDGIRPEQAGCLTPEEVPNKFRPEVAEANSLGQHTMKNCLNVKKTNNINVNFSNNCSECNYGTDEGTASSPNEPQKIDEKYSIGSNYYISLKEAKEYESGDHASLVSCNDEHYDLTQFSSGPTSNYVKPGAETGDARDYASRAEWGLPNNTFRSGDHTTAGVEAKITNSLERIYKEVSSFISANESRTKYLTELFVNLKKLDSEELRLRAVSALNTIVAEQLTGRSLTSAVHSEENNNRRAFLEDETERDNHSFIEIENWDILSQYNSDAEVLKSYNTNGGYRETQQIIKSKSQPTAGLRFKSMSDCKLQSDDNDSEDYESSDFDEHGMDDISQRRGNSTEHLNSICGKPDEKSKSLEPSPKESPENIGKSKEVNALIESEEGNELSEKTEKVIKSKSKEYVQSVFDIISKSNISSDSMNLSSFDKFIEKIRNPTKSQNILSGDEDDEDNDENDDEDDDDDDDDDGDNDDAAVSDKEDNTDEDNEVDDKEGDDDDDEDDDDKEDDDVVDDDNDYDDEDNDDENSVKKKRIKSPVPKESSIASDVTKSTAKSSSSSASNSSVQASDSDDDDDDGGDDNDENAENDGDDDEDEDDDGEGDNDIDNDDDDDDDEDDEDEDVTDAEEEKKDEDDKEDDDDDDDDEGESHLIHKDEGKGDGASVTTEEKHEKISNPSKTYDKNEHPSNQNAGSYDVDDDNVSGSSQNHNNDCKNFEDVEEDLIKGIGNESYYEENDVDERDFKDMCNNNHVDGRFIIPSHYKDEDFYGEDQGDRDMTSDCRQPCSRMEVEMQIFRDDHVENDAMPKARNDNNALQDFSACFLNNNNKDGDAKAESVDLLEHGEMSPEQLEEYLLSKEMPENNEKLSFERKENLLSTRKLDDMHRKCFSLTEHDSECPLTFDFSSDPEFKHEDSKTNRGTFQYPVGHLKEKLSECEMNNKTSSAEESLKEKTVNEGDCEIKEMNQKVKYNNHTKFLDHNGKPENHNHKSEDVDEEVDQLSDDDIYWGKQQRNISSTSQEKHSSLNKCGKGSVSHTLDGQSPLMPFSKLVGKSRNLNINSFNLSKEVIDRWERHRKYAKTQDIYEGAKRMFGIKSNTSRSPYSYSARHSEHIVQSKAKKIFKPSNILGLKEPKNLYVDPLKLIKAKKHKRDPSNRRKCKKKERQLQVDNIFTGRRKSSLSLSKTIARSSSKCNYVYRRDERDDYDDDSYSLISEEFDNEHYNDHMWKSSDEDKSLLTSSYMHRRSRLP